MPARLLRDGILDSEAVDRLTLGGEVFYRRLMSAVDDFGRFDARPAVLLARLYPLRLTRVSAAKVAGWLAECEKAGLVQTYDHAGKPYLWFRRLGTPRAKESKYPPPPDSSPPLQPPQSASPAVESVCVQVNADESKPEQTPAFAPYSGSDSYSGSDAGGADGGEAPPPPDRPASKRPSRFDPLAMALPHGPPFAAKWAEWVGYRRQRKLSLAEACMTRQLAGLAAVAEAAAVGLIEYSLTGGYQSLYFDRDGRPAGGGRGPPASRSEQTTGGLMDVYLNTIPETSNDPPEA